MAVTMELLSEFEESEPVISLELSQLLWHVSPMPNAVHPTHLCGSDGRAATLSERSKTLGLVVGKK